MTILLRKMRGLILGFSLITCVSLAGANCRDPAPTPGAFANSGSSCPSGYYSSGNACVPSGSSSHYAFLNPGGGSCPSGYYSSGSSCVASSKNSCRAFLMVVDHALLGITHPVKAAFLIDLF